MKVIGTETGNDWKQNWEVEMIGNRIGKWNGK